MTVALTAFMLMACGGRSAAGSSDTSQDAKSEENVSVAEKGATGKGAAEKAAMTNFDADSAYAYVAKQVAFGPRVPNTEAHRLCGDWLASELRRHGAKVFEQRAALKAFDGTVLNARNIFGSINPDVPERVLLLAHWDCRPWADADPDPANRKKPVDGANDGASGVGVILEIARQLKASGSKAGVDFLFVDAEDWGTEGDENSWALGTKYFVENLSQIPQKSPTSPTPPTPPTTPTYSPDYAILLDMVGGKGAEFYREYFSERAAPALASKIWSAAAQLGYGDIFHNRLGGAVTDDHIQLISHGIPAVDIIEYHPDAPTGFTPRWHTVNDTMEGIDPATLAAVGKTVLFSIEN